MAIDIKKILNSKTVKIAALIVVPIALTGVFLGYQYIMKKRDENKIKKMIEEVKTDNGESIVPKKTIPVVEKTDTNLTDKK